MKKTLTSLFAVAQLAINAGCNPKEKESWYTYGTVTKEAGTVITNSGSAMTNPLVKQTYVIQYKADHDNKIHTLQIYGYVDALALAIEPGTRIRFPTSYAEIQGRSLVGILGSRWLEVIDETQASLKNGN